MLGDEPQILVSEAISLLKKERLIMENYEKMIKEWKQFRNPNGQTQDNPVTTCAHLFASNTEIESGKFSDKMKLIIIFSIYYFNKVSTTLIQMKDHHRMLSKYIVTVIRTAPV